MSVTPGGHRGDPGCPAGQTGGVVSQVAVADASDPRLADYVGLTDVHLRRSLESGHGLFMAEGEKVIRRAAPRCTSCRPRWPGS